MIKNIESFKGLNITFNTNEDCNLACKYACVEGTKILMADLTEKNIEDVKKGDIIIGFDEENVPHKFRRMHYAEVLNGGFTEEVDYYYLFKTKNRELGLSAPHPILNQRNVFVTAEDFCNSSEVGKKIYSDYIPRKRDIEFTSDYKIGYIIACWMGDGSFIKYPTCINMRFAVKDEEITNRLKDFMTDFDFKFDIKKMKISEKYDIYVDVISSPNCASYDKLTGLISKNILKNESIDYYRGFFAGIYDTEGGCGESNIYRISNEDSTIINEITDAVQRFYEHKIVSNPFIDSYYTTFNKGMNYPLTTITFAADAARKLIEYTQPACTRKYATIENKCLYSREGVTIGRIFEKKRVFNLTTSTGTFIANGFLVHNCYELNKKPKVLSLDYAKKFIDIILTDPDPIGCIGTKDEWIINQGLILDFIGGDSFMHVDLMDAILNYFVYRVHTITPDHKWANNWRISISSNGTLFGNKECQDFIKKWRDVLSLGISIDGCPAIHDANRIFAKLGPHGKEVGSMATIKKWWPWLREINPLITESTKSTCSKSSIPYLFESLQFMHEELGIVYINQNFIMEPTGCIEEDYIELENQLAKCREYVFNHRNEMHWSMMDEHFLKRLSDKDIDLNRNWCGSGSMPALSISGKIYPCFRWLPHTQEDESKAEKYCVGDVWNGFNNKKSFKKVRNATRKKISPPECLVCEYEPCCSYCYQPDTPILMADFSTKEICDVKVGDLIIAFDEFPKRRGVRRKYQIAKVEQTFSRNVNENLYYIDESKYGATGEHPILTKKENYVVFAPIKEVKTKHHRIFRHDPSMVDNFAFNHNPSIGLSTEVKITKKPYEGPVYNLKTSTRTYIADNVLVHNCIGGCYSEFGCFKRTTHICDITKVLAKAAEEYWRMYDKAEGTNHFQTRTQVK